MGGIFQRRCSADHDDAAPRTGLVDDNKYIKLRFEVERKTDRQDGKQLVSPATYHFVLTLKSG